MGWLPKPSDKEREREKEKEKEREKEKEKEREREKEKEKDSQVSQDDLGQNLRKVIDGIMGHSVLMSHLFSQREAAEVSTHLFVLCEAADHFYPSLTSLARFEIQKSDNISELFKLKSVSNHFFRRYCRCDGASYLKELFTIFFSRPALPSDLSRFEELNSMEGSTFRYFPQSNSTQSHTSKDTPAKQRKQVLASFKIFMKLLVGSLPNLPETFREVSREIYLMVQKKFGSSQAHTFLLGHFFTRFLCPALAILDPSSAGIEVNYTSRLLGVLISKIVGMACQDSKVGFDTECMKFANDVLPLGHKYVGIVVAFLSGGDMSDETKKLAERHQNEYKTFSSLGLGSGITSSSSASSLTTSSAHASPSFSSSSSSIPTSNSSPAPPLTNSNLSDLFSEFPSLDGALSYFSSFLKRDDTIIRQGVVSATHSVDEMRLSLDGVSSIERDIENLIHFYEMRTTFFEDETLATQSDPLSPTMQLGQSVTYPDPFALVEGEEESGNDNISSLLSTSIKDLEAGGLAVVMKRFIINNNSFSTFLSCVNDQEELLGNFYHFCEVLGLEELVMIEMFNEQIQKTKETFSLSSMDQFSTLFYQEFNQQVAIKFVAPILNKFYQDLSKEDDDPGDEMSSMSDEEIMSAFLRLLKMFVGSLSNIPPSLKYICSVISQKIETLYGMNTHRDFLLEMFYNSCLIPALSRPASLELHFQASPKMKKLGVVMSRMLQIALKGYSFDLHVFDEETLAQTTKYINVTLCELCSAPLPSGLSRIRIECADQFRDIPNDSIPKKGDGRNLVQSVQYLARFFQGNYDEMRKKIKKDGDGDAAQVLMEARDELLFESGLVSMENNTSRQLQRNVSFLSSKQQHKRATHRASPSKNVVANKFGDSAFLQYDQQPPQPRKKQNRSKFGIVREKLLGPQPEHQSSESSQPLSPSSKPRKRRGSITFTSQSTISSPVNPPLSPTSSPISPKGYFSPTLKSRSFALSKGQSLHESTNSNRSSKDLTQSRDSSKKNPRRTSKDFSSCYTSPFAPLSPKKRSGTFSPPPVLLSPPRTPPPSEREPCSPFSNKREYLPINTPPTTLLDSPLPAPSSATDLRPEKGKPRPYSPILSGEFSLTPSSSPSSSPIALPQGSAYLSESSSHSSPPTSSSMTSPPSFTSSSPNLFQNTKTPYQLPVSRTAGTFGGPKDIDEEGTVSFSPSLLSSSKLQERYQALLCSKDDSFASEILSVNASLSSSLPTLDQVREGMELMTKWLLEGRQLSSKALQMLQFYINQAHLFNTPRKTPHSAKEKKEKKKHDGEKRGKGSKLTTPLNLGSDQGTEKYPSPPSLPRSISSSEVKTSKSKPQRSSTSPKTPKANSLAQGKGRRAPSPISPSSRTASASPMNLKSNGRASPPLPREIDEMDVKMSTLAKSFITTQQSDMTRPRRRVKKMASEDNNSPEESKTARTVDFNHAKITKVLAPRGGSGAAVYVCDVDGMCCAVKEFHLAQNMKETNLKEKFQREIEMIEKLSHPNIVKYLHHSFRRNTIQLFLTRYEASLRLEIQTRYEDVKADMEDLFQPKDILRMMLDVANGLQYLHRNQIIHRDLKTDNIFITYDARGQIGRCVIGDFDSAKLIANDATMKTITGTTNYIAPQIMGMILDPTIAFSYTLKADIWSFGMVMYELLTLELPYGCYDMTDALSNIQKGVRPPIPPTPNGFPSADEIEDYAGVISIHEECSALEEGKRPTIEEVRVKLEKEYAKCSW